MDVSFYKRILRLNRFDIRNMEIKKTKITRNDIKRIILKGNKLEITSAIFERWNLKNRKTGWLPYKED